MTLLIKLFPCLFVFLEYWVCSFTKIEVEQALSTQLANKKSFPQPVNNSFRYTSTRVFFFFQIRSELVDKLTDVVLTDTTQAQQTVGALIEATKHKTELTPKTQVSRTLQASSSVVSLISFSLLSFQIMKTLAISRGLQLGGRKINGYTFESI